MVDSTGVTGGDAGGASTHIQRSKGMTRDGERGQQQDWIPEISQSDANPQMHASVQVFIAYLADVCELSVHEQQTLLSIANRLISGSTAFSIKPIGRATVHASDKEHLTAREHEVLAWLASEKRPEDIAEKLGISVSTIHSHATNIYAKLGVSSRGEAVLVARSYGILTHSD